MQLAYFKASAASAVVQIIKRERIQEATTTEREREREDECFENLHTLSILGTFIVYIYTYFEHCISLPIKLPDRF